ncbi:MULTISPECIES: hypothetical protein [unclassified Curtobacterium]|uniref:hypothetical protein n=1 Tax=unclassified Curtobacterium TaxID=257496 RepID=UPI00226B6831|nr:MULTISPECIES: hypothetical protein [unclassified Curtobacterium]
MSATPVLTSRIDVEVPQWLVVPGTADVTPAWRAGALELFAAIAQVDRDAPADQRVFDGGPEVDPEAALDTLLEFRAALDGGERLVAGLGVPNRWPLPVVVSVGMAESDGPGLLELAGAEGGLPVERPAVDELPDHVGGEGPVVTRYDLDDDGAIWATVCAVRRETFTADDTTTPVDTRVLWRTRDLDVVPVFGDELIDLLAAVKNEVTA